jgi:hypothetical protein
MTRPDRPLRGPAPALAALLLLGCSSPFPSAGGPLGKGPGADAEAGSDGGQDGGDGEGSGAAPLTFAPAAFSRLTARQVQNVLDDLFPDARAVALEADTNPYLFTSIGASTTNLSEQGVELLEQAGWQVATEVFADPVRRAEAVGCAPASPGDACVAAYLERFGRRAWRRPLTAAEQARWLGVSVDLAGGDPWVGLQFAVAGMLQSPNLLYKPELGAPDPDDPSRLLLTDWEIATRLSFLLWNTGPDEQLLDAAAAGRLGSPEGRAAEVERLLADPRADEAISVFLAEYLDLARLDRADKDPGTYPGFTPTLKAAMRAEVLLLADEVVNRRDADLRLLFSQPRAYVNSELAAHYGIEAEGAGPITFVPVDLPPESGRAGILSLGAFLSMNAHPVDNSPTLRGKYVVERLLCLTVPPPPADVDTAIEPATDEARTLRERLDQHRADPACAACHDLIDPPGFLFENFDATGRWRELDNGYPIDSSGSLLGVSLSGAADLGALLGSHEQVAPCVVKQLYRHAHGRLDVAADQPSLAALSAGFVADGHRLRGLFRDLALHPSFTTIAAPEAR